MKIQKAVPFVDTNVIPDRNAGIGSLLRDLRNSQDPDRDGSPLLDPEFAFIDVGVSRAKVATALKKILTGDLKMDVVYVATELPAAVPYANVTLLGDRAEKICGCLSAVFSSKGAACEVKDWHFVVDRNGKVTSVAYSYNLHGNEFWESYFMGRKFIYSGEPVEFSDSRLNEMLAPDVQKIEARIDLERKRDNDPSQPAPSWDGYRMEKNPLEAGLAEFRIILQKTDVPQRIKDRQNVLFLGNVLNHYPQEERARELDRVAADLEEGDVVIVQVDEVGASSVEVLHVKGQGEKKTRERVKWINTKTLEVQKPDRASGSKRQIRVKPKKEPLLTITGDARQAIMKELKARSKLSIKGLRVKATPLSPIRARFNMAFIPEAEADSPTDIIQSFDGFDVYIDPESALYLHGASIHYLFKIVGSGLVVNAPLRKLDTPENFIAGNIQQIIDEEINPSLASHAGGAVLIDFKDGVVYVELTGGCQGCGMAGTTVKSGIELTLKSRIPEIREVLDVTDHANGKNPYFMHG